MSDRVDPGQPEGRQIGCQKDFGVFYENSIFRKTDIKVASRICTYPSFGKGVVGRYMKKQYRSVTGIGTKPSKKTSYRLGPFAWAHAFFYETGVTVLINEINTVVMVGETRVSLTDLYSPNVPKDPDPVRDFEKIAPSYSGGITVQCKLLFSHTPGGIRILKDRRDNLTYRFAEVDFLISAEKWDKKREAPVVRKILGKKYLPAEYYRQESEGLKNDLIKYFQERGEEGKNLREMILRKRFSFLAHLPLESLHIGYCNLKGDEKEMIKMFQLPPMRAVKREVGRLIGVMGEVIDLNMIYYLRMCWLLVRNLDFLLTCIGLLQEYTEEIKSYRPQDLQRVRIKRTMVRLSGIRRIRKAAPEMDVKRWLMDFLTDLREIEPEYHCYVRKLSFYRDTELMVSQLQEYYGYFLKNYSCPGRRMQEIHDRLCLDQLAIKEEDLSLPRPRIKETEREGYVLRFPDKVSTLKLWGKKMHNCVAGYADLVRERKCYIGGIFYKEKLLYNVEVKRKKVIQIAGVCNNNVAERDHEPVSGLLEKAGIEIQKY